MTKIFSSLTVAGGVASATIPYIASKDTNSRDKQSPPKKNFSECLLLSKEGRSNNENKIYACRDPDSEKANKVVLFYYRVSNTDKKINRIIGLKQQFENTYTPKLAIELELKEGAGKESLSKQWPTWIVYSGNGLGSEELIPERDCEMPFTKTANANTFKFTCLGNKKWEINDSSFIQESLPLD